jgi:hypothetical protein
MTEDEELIYLMGTILILLQAAEKVINLAMTWVLRDESVRTIDDIMQLNGEHRKKTLGFFFNRLRRIFSVNTKFNDLLERFLTTRNLFIHSLSDVPGFNLDTEDGRKIAEQFLVQFNHDTMLVLKIFAAFTQDWLLRTGADKEIRADVPSFYKSDFYKSVDQEILPYLDVFLARKTAPNRTRI